MDIQKNQHQQNSQSLSGKGREDDAVNLFFEKKSILTHYGESLTISDTLHRPSIGKLVKTNGNDSMLVFVTGLLYEFISFVPHGLDSDDITLYAEKILAHCSKWSTADLVLCLKNGIDGKYGPVKFKWTWNSDFVEWAKKYDQQKDDFFFKKHVEKVNNAKLENAELIKLFPKELIDEFAKAKFVDQEKRKLLDIKIPKDIVAKGLDAVDQYIEQMKKIKP